MRGDVVDQVDALVDLRVGRGAEPDADGAELVEDRVAEDHDAGVRRVGADRVVDVVEQAGQRALGLVLGGLHRGDAWRGAVQRAGRHDVGEADVVAADGDADQRGVELLSAESCELITLVVVAPEQATEVYEAGALAAAHSAG